MGRASNRKKARREAAAAGLSNPIVRKATALATHNKVVKELQSASTEEQLEVLGSISPSKVGKAIMKKAPGQMDKGIRKLQKQGDRITKDILLKDVRETPGFLSLCENAGVPYSWFEKLAEDRMQRLGVNDPLIP